MDACDGGNIGFQQESNPVTSCESNPMSQEASLVAMSSMMMVPKPPNVHHDPFFSSGWDSLSSMNQYRQNLGCLPVSHRDFGHFAFSPVPLWENQGINPHLAQYPTPDSSLVKTVPQAPCLMSQGLPNMLGPMGLPQYGQIHIPGPNRTSNVEGGASEGTRNREGDTMGSPSTEGKRKRMPNSSSPCDRKKVISVVPN